MIQYGLWANIYSKDIARALRVAKRIEAGCVNINQTGPSGYALDLPFGGYKQSGEGKELGRQGLEAWVEVCYYITRFILRAIPKTNFFYVM